ncbi:hypothetical protein K461DRAFT_73876 [Myriangium duriaei CBS 260.36]|uniref:DUF7053 domain-containing protein n=1 Tax=Myriangium duriaei CBS 260.36 TaxID=1168546 RepID=A0A9P4IU44_9PEZI|nr:hypothetical protein K461DRAFT_73876 [Myriangium duriaei CBS 260.36]
MPTKILETSFAHSSQEPLDPSVPDETILDLLHDFGTVIHCNPDCKTYLPANSAPKNIEVPPSASVYDCEDALAFIPRKLWNGGVWYQAVYMPQPQGCDITIKAPGGFTSVNRWRLKLNQDGTKDVTIESDAKCNRTFAIFVERFLPGSHQTQHQRFREKLVEVADGLKKHDSTQMSGTS